MGKYNKSGGYVGRRDGCGTYMAKRVVVGVCIAVVMFFVRQGFYA